MNFIKSVVGTCVLAGGMAIPAMAYATDCYAVNFRNAMDAKSRKLDKLLQSAIQMSGQNIEEVVIDTTTAAKWEKGAHEAFDRDLVHQFNIWVGLPGFVAIVNARTKRTIGCVNSSFTTAEMASEIKKMCEKAGEGAYLSNADYSLSPNQSYIIKASVSTKTTRCPAAHNVDPGR